MKIPWSKVFVDTTVGLSSSRKHSGTVNQGFLLEANHMIYGVRNYNLNVRSKHLVDYIRKNLWNIAADFVNRHGSFLNNRM